MTFSSNDALPIWSFVYLFILTEKRVYYTDEHISIYEMSIIWTYVYLWRISD